AHHPLPWEGSDDGLIWSAKDAPGDPVGGSSDPDVVRLILVAAEDGLRGLAEDRDILRRHKAIQELATWPTGSEWMTLCAYEWRGGNGHLVRWHRCAEVRSLARRLGVEVES
ncbi:MAG TPA: hypothetical protein VFY84_03000, partial [Jiangellales bacterium]|nr:hypothetical protein [Jiangellales bacterium]